MTFYVLEAPKSDQSDAETICLDAEKTQMGTAPRCPVCGAAVGQLRPLPPRQIEVALGGRRFGDLGFGLGTELLVSERFRDAFVKSGLTGLPVFTPAEIIGVIARFGKIPTPIPSYFVAAPARSRAIIDDRASGIDYSQRWKCKECKSGMMMRLRRLVLEPGSWSGEDIFIARGLPGTVITSERFKQFCDRHSFSNCFLVDADRYHFDFFPNDRRFSPTRA